MSCRVIHLAEDPAFVGRAVCAIGVFDGVHVGHSALISDTVQMARQRRVGSFAITFDRDPDQVLTPQTAAPQLLTWEDKAAFLCAVGLDAVLVVPFTPHTAALSPSEFVIDVLLSAVDPVAILVGEDFRFGRRAQGSVSTLRELCEPRGISVHANELVRAGGLPVTSTRIRALVASGDVKAASVLLGRPHRVSGKVGHGRGEGAAMGVATANIEAVEFSAVPSVGVYAGRAVIGSHAWPAAISVGVPPTFPEATDTLEVHLIGFEGDLYEESITIEFLSRLRDQRVFDTTEALVSAIRADIRSAETIAADAETRERVAADAALAHRSDTGSSSLSARIGNMWRTLTFAPRDTEPEVLEDGAPVVEDPAALADAESHAAGIDAAAAYGLFDETWVEVLGPTALGGFVSAGAVNAFMLTSPLAAAGIPFVWLPFPPEAQQNVRPDFNYWQRFRLYVPPRHEADARQLLGTLSDRGRS